MDKQDMYSMDLGEKIHIAFYEVIRVPGGWMFSCAMGVAFVPFDTNFRSSHTSQNTRRIEMEQLHGSSSQHTRYKEKVNPKSRRRCCCGCGKRATHRGMANGICLMMGCDFSVRVWVRDGKF